MKKSMKTKSVLVVHNYYQIPGGEDTVVANEIKLLREYGHEVFFYSRNNAELKKLSKMKKLLLPLTTVFNPQTYREIRKIIREKKIDIVHVHNTLNLVSPSVYYAARSSKVPIVQTIHNFRLLCPAATFYREGHICEDCMKKGLSCAVKHNCYRGSKIQTLACVLSTKIHRMLGIYHKINYICLTEFNKEKLLELNTTQRKEVITPQNVFVKPNMTFAGERKTNPQVEDYYLFVGRVEKIKGMEVLIDAFSKLREEKLLIAGKGTELEYYQNVVMQQKIENIQFLGFQEKAQLQNLMQKARAVIVPSQWYEGFPMTIVEAFSLGTPVIGADIGNVGSLIEHRVNGWKFRHDSSVDLVEKIKECNAMPKDKMNIVCEETLLSDGNYKKLNEIYECILKKESGTK